MQVHFIDSGTQQDLGFKEVDCHSFKMDADDAPYAIVSNPFRPTDSCRAEFTGTEWVVDFD